MFVPIGDSNPLKTIPFQIVTAGIVTLCAIVYLYQLGLPREAQVALAYGYGVVPTVLTGADSLPAGLPAAPSWLTPVTYQFLHGGFWHLVGNMLFLWVFGDNVEDAMGHGRFLVFFVLCGALAALMHTAVMADARPLIGASGAVSGVIAAYLMLHPCVKVLVLLFNWLPIRLPVWLVLGAWIGLQFFNLAADSPGQTAWLAHVGGLVVGALLVPVFKRRDVRLFDAAAPAAAAASSESESASESAAPDEPDSPVPRGPRRRSRLPDAGGEAAPPPRGPPGPWGGG